MSKDIFGLRGAVFVTVKPVTPDFEVGHAVQVVVQTLGGSLFPSPMTINVYDNDTNRIIGSFSGTQEPRTTQTTIIDCGLMPEHTLIMRAELTTDTGTSTALLSAQMRPPSITVENVTLNPVITKEEAKIILQDAGIAPSTIETVLPKFTYTPPVVRPPTGEAGPPVTLPSLPWYASWIEPVLMYIGSLTESVVNFFAPIFSPLDAIANYLKDPFGSVSKHIGDMMASASKSGTDLAVQATKDATGHTPDFATDMRDTINTALYGPVDELILEVSKTLYGYNVLDPQAANGKLADFAKTAKLIHAQTFVSGAISEAVSLGQFEALQKFTDMVLGPFGLGELAKLDIVLPLEPSLITPTKQYWRSVYPNEIPSTGDLINMVVKEKIDLSTFRKNMKYNGISEDWSNKIWDAHFNAPSLGQLLTSWRRDHITTEELDKLEVLVDLDPIYKTFWKDQRYNDPSIMSARFMFETKNIDKDGVKDILKRNGLFPSDVDAMANYIVTFQERLWRRRYIMAVAAGYRQGVYQADFLTSKVLDAGYTDGVAHWIIETENARAEISKSKVKVQKDVLVTLTIAIDAYINNDVDELWLRNYFYIKGYDPSEIDIAVKVYNRKKTSVLSKVEGGEGVA
jgi:hypothetical protein